MAKDHRPAFQFYPGDWMKSETRVLSLEARGAWIDLLCIMFEAPRRGYLEHKIGEKISNLQLARVLGIKEKKVENVLRELIDCNVCSVDDNGVLFSRRMVRDERVSQVRRECGSLGGNPILLNQEDNQTSNQNGSKTQANAKPKRKQNPTPSTSSSLSTAIPTTLDGVAKPQPRKARTTDLTAVQLERFERWYVEYPKKVSRGEAEKAWRALDPSDALTEEMIEAADIQKSWKQWRKDGGQFIPNPASWIRAKGWLDQEPEVDRMARMPTPEEDAAWTPYGDN